MPPIEAIVANTSRNAWLMGLEGEVGVIAPGKLADIVIWNSDPLADITVLQRPSEISTIIKDGRIVDREAGGSGQAVNPDGIRNQIEGGILQSASWTLYESITSTGRASRAAIGAAIRSCAFRRCRIRLRSM